MDCGKWRTLTPGARVSGAAVMTSSRDCDVGEGRSPRFRSRRCPPPRHSPHAQSSYVGELRTKLDQNTTENNEDY